MSSTAERMKDAFRQAEITARMANHTGCLERFRHWTGRLQYTDGMKDIADQCDAHWLIDAIASHQSAKVNKECDGFQVWTLKWLGDKNGVDQGWVLECRRDTNDPPCVSQKIEYSDFPMPEIKLYVEGGPGDYVLLLPSEH